MSDYVEQYEQELRRIEPFQERQEWREWLAGMEAGLKEFFDLVPDMPADPWSADGARHAEAAALRIFPDKASASLYDAPDNLHLIDPFRRYLGELMVRRFEGEWVAIDFDEGQAPEPGVRIPHTSIYFDPAATLTTAMSRRTGDRWARLVERQARAHAKWVEAGRPSLPEWQEMRDQAAVS